MLSIFKIMSINDTNKAGINQYKDGDKRLEIQISEMDEVLTVNE